MAKCRFCGKRFPSPQAVRGHLRACEAYRSGGPELKAQPNRLAQLKSSASSSGVKAGGIAESALDELQAERAKLDLRKTKAEHRRLDEEDAERARQAREQKDAARRQAEAATLAREQARWEAEERQQREAAEAERQRQRRGIIQRAKDHVDSAYAEGVIRAPEGVRATMLAEVERVLAGMPVDELSFSEVVRYAEGVRDKHYRPVVEAHRRQEDEQRRRAAAHARLVAHGKRYAEDRLDAEGVQGFDRPGITLGLGPALDREVEGTESTGDVEQLVEGLLAPEIKRVRRQAEERQRQEEARERQRREQEEERRRREAEWQRQRREQERERAERAEEAHLAANRQRLALHGEVYALRVMNEENALADDLQERFQVAREVKEQLLEELDGDESEEEVEDLVGEILDEELGEE